jgi:hypothetical protein
MAFAQRLEGPAFERGGLCFQLSSMGRQVLGDLTV